jgi:4-diphosphocytidyl-2-C-methyl-D-erythritol kinase
LSETLRLLAPAKINLTLEVLGRRNDGFHEVRMLMAGVALFDELSFQAAPQLSLSCDRPELDCGSSNLVLRAATALQRTLGPGGFGYGAKISLKKRIPLGGGLAGGSTDAAATLVGLNKLWKLRLSLEALRKIGATLGSDIPFCVESGWALATGRGEKLKALSLRRKLHFVLANPGFEVSTKWAYSSLPKLAPPKQNRSRQAFEAIQAKDLGALEHASVNDLEPVTAGRYAEIRALKGLMLEHGAQMTRMSGSGPTVWGLFDTETAAEKAYKKLKNQAKTVAIVQTLNRIPEAF